MQAQFYTPPQGDATNAFVHLLTDAAPAFELDLESMLDTLDLIRERDAAIERGDWLFGLKYDLAPNTKLPTANGGAA